MWEDVKIYVNGLLACWVDLSILPAVGSTVRLQLRGDVELREYRVLDRRVGDPAALNVTPVVT